MFKTIIFLLALTSNPCFAQQEREIMYQIEDTTGFGRCGYVNALGDTLAPFGKYDYCFSDGLNYAIVLPLFVEGSPIGIDSKGNTLFHVFVFDNGPDYIEEGTFRIIEDGKIGYATQDGEISIATQFEGAWPFENGRALVSFMADKESDGEHWWWTGVDWFYIDKNGNRIEE